MCASVQQCSIRGRFVIVSVLLIGALVGLTLLPPVSTAQNQLAFTPVVMGTGTPPWIGSPISDVLSDFNGDGYLDLAIAYVWADLVGVYLNRGDGTFIEPPAFYSVGNGPYTVLAYDVDNDGDSDLMSANQTQEIDGSKTYGDHLTVLLNQGNGTFGGRVDYGQGSYARSAALGDLDGDGDPDAVATNADSNTVAILLNQGDGTFQDEAEYQVDEYPHFVTLGDLDGDRDLDMVVSNNSANTVSVLFNSGNAQFPNQVSYSTDQYPCTGGLADLDHDGDLDLVIPNRGGQTVTVYNNDGTGDFTQHTDYDSGPGPTHTVIQDVDNDGDLDLITSNYDMGRYTTVTVLYNDGTGGFNATSTHDAGGPPVSVAAGDLELDGDVDIVTANYWNATVSVLYNQLDPVPPLHIVTETALPESRVGSLYKVTLTAEGGSQPYSWSILSGVLPPGLSLEETTGVIRGVPTVAGVYSFTVQVTDSGGLSDEHAATVTVLDFASTAIWSRSYATPDREGFNAVAATPDGGSIAAGHTLSSTAGGYDFWVVKLDSLGEVVWQRTYGGTREDYAMSIIVANDGGYVVAGYTESFGSGNGDGWVLKLDGDGDVVWQRALDVAMKDHAKSIIPASNGGYIVVLGEHFAGGGGDIWVVRLDESGEILWQQSYGAGGLDTANIIAPTSDGGYVLAGYTTSFGGGWDGLVIKLSAAGAIEWQKVYGGPDDDIAMGITQTRDGGYVFVGYTETFGAGGQDGWMERLDDAGNIIWSRTYGDGHNDYGYRVIEAADGSYFVSGLGSQAWPNPGLNTWLLKVDDSGDIRSVKAYNWTAPIIQATEGGFLLAGETMPSDGWNTDGWVAKLDPNGNLPATCETIEPVGWPTSLALYARSASVSLLDTSGVALETGAIPAQSEATTLTQCLQILPPAGTDLAVLASAISFAPENPGAGQALTIQAAVSNQGLSDLANVRVRVYDFDALLGEVVIPSLSSGADAPLSIEAEFAEAGYRLIRVVADPLSAIGEVDENNNEASQLLQVGQPPSDAAIVVQASPVSVCRGGIAAVTGRADYDFPSVPGQQDHPVQGADVTVKVLDPVTGGVLSQFAGSHTDVSGQFGQGILAPQADGTYALVVEVTDHTITQSFHATLQVSGACPLPPPPPPPPPPGPGGPPAPPGPNTPPSAVRDVYVFSEDIHFSKNNPEEEETIAVLAYVHYYGSEPASAIPVTLNDLYPVDGVLRIYKIGSALVNYPDGGRSSPVVISVPWTSSRLGAHVIQVVADPEFPQFTINDKATRSIFVGTLPPVTIDKNVALMTDTDGDGRFSPGDVLRYTISYANEGGSAITGVVILDDYDEMLLQTPSATADGGVVSDGAVSWNLGMLPAGASGSVTYEANIKPLGEFPAGRTVIGNTALLTSDQTAPIADTANVEVMVNRPPVIDAGGPYAGDEGSPIVLADASVSDADGDDTTISWSVVPAQCVFSDPSALNPTLACLDNGEYTLTVTAIDGAGGVSSDTTVANINDLGPTAAHAWSPEPQDEGTPVQFTDQSTSYPDEIVAWNWVFLGTNTSAERHPSFAFDDNGSYGVCLAATDDDGSVDSVCHPVTVNNVAPTIESITGLADPVLITAQPTTLQAVFSDPGVADTHDIAWEWGDGTSETQGNVSSPATGSHTYAEPGVFAVTITVTDDDGGSDTEVYEFVVVYDPEGGFVTGGGWIQSAAGWCQLSDLCAGAEGKANFGFVSKYKKGASVPTGNTEFNFSAGDFNFHSDLYEWLVVNQSGTNAQFKGSGTINGGLAPNGTLYKFMIWATDQGSVGADTFRIKIWYEDGIEQVVYDNGFNQPIGGGNIVVHVK